MDAATLRVLVEVNGVRRATKELRDVDQAGVRAARSAHNAAGGFDDADKSARRASKGFSGLAAAMGGGSGGIRNFARNLDRFGGAAGGATATIGGFRIALAALVPIFVGFGGAAIAAGASLGPLIGLAAAAGNAFAAAAQGVGVFKLAVMGIGGALKEQMSNQGKAGGSAASNAGAQRAAANAIITAQEGVGSSLRALSDAQRDHREAVAALPAAYTAARRALVDMQASVREAVLNEASLSLGLRDARKALDELIRGASPLDLADAQDAVADSTRNTQRAVLDLGDAQAALNALMSDPSASAEDIARARLNLQDAENAVSDARRAAVRAAMDLAELEKPAGSDALAEARLRVAQAENDLANARRDRVREQKDLNAAERAGINGSPEVIQARGAIADAELAVSDAHRDVAKSRRALTEAQRSANEAMASGAAGAAALNDKFNDLPPAAQAFVRVLMSMKPQLDALRATAASGFFPGATEGLKSAARNFEPVRRVVGQTAEVLGDLARRAGELVGSAAFGRDIETIGGRNAKVIDTLGGALLHVVSALRHVMVAAGPLTQWLADSIEKWALNTAVAAKAGRENGKLAAFFEKTRAITERLVSIVQHLGSGLLGLGRVGKRTGDDIWASIDRAAARFDEWANSVGGQKTISEFFKDTRELAAALTPVLSGLASGIGLVVLRIMPLTAILRVLGPYASEATVAFLAYKTAVIATALASKLATAATWLLGTALKSTLIARVLVPVFWALNAALAANPIGLVVLALAALAAGLVIAYKHSETFRDIVGAVWNFLRDLIVGHVKFIASMVVGAWEAIRGATAAVWPAIRTVLTGQWNAIRGAAVAVFGAIVGVVGGTWATISDGASSAWGSIRSAASAAWGAVRDSILVPMRTARDTMGEILHAIRGALTGAWDAIRGTAREAWNAVEASITSAVRGAYSTVRGLLEQFIGLGGDIIRGIAQGIRNTAGDVIRAIKEAVTDRLPGFVKKALGIKSPSRVFMELGRQVSLGMAQGITSEASRVQRAMTEIATVPSVARGTVGEMGYVHTPVQRSAMAAPTAQAGVTVMGDLVVQDRGDADALAARLAWLGEHG